MEELVEYIERTPKARHAYRWKHYLRSLPQPLCDVKGPKTWQQAYSLKDINSALSHVQIVAYNEKIVSLNQCMLFSLLIKLKLIAFSMTRLVFS